MRDKNGRFIVGHSKVGKCGCPKGIHNSPSTEFKKGHVSNRPMGIHPRTEFKSGMIAYNKGLDSRRETKCPTCGNIFKHYGIKIYCSNKCKNINKDFREKHRTSLIGRKMPPDTSRPNLRGKKNPNYKDGKSKENRTTYESLEYRKWRRQLFERDSFTCQNCDSIGGVLEAHHIKPQSKYPELKFDNSNAVTLCRDCHVLIDDYLRPKELRD